MLIDPPVPPPQFLEVAHVAHRLHVSQQFVRKLIRVGKLKAVRFESLLRIDERDLHAYIEAQRRASDDTTRQDRRAARGPQAMTR